MSYEALNIPLQSQNTRRPWRVLWILLSIGIALFLWFIFTTVPKLLDQTSQYKPSNTTETIRITPNIKQKQLLYQQIGDIPVSENSNIQFYEILSAMNQELSLHLSELRFTGITIDTNIAGELAYKWQASGNTVHVKDGKTLLAVGTNISEGKTKLALKQILPWCNGKFITNAEETCLRIHAKGIDIRIAHNEPRSSFFLPSNSSVLATFHLPKTNKVTYFKELLFNESYEKLQTAMERNGVDVYIGHDQQGPVFTLFIPNHTMNAEEQGQLLSSLAKPFSLSGKQLTIDDDTIFTEIRSNSGQNIFEISNSGFVNISTLRTPNNAVFRTTSTPDGIMISNREIDLTFAINTPIGDCLPNAHSIIRTQEVVNILNSRTIENQLPTILSQTVTIEANSRKLRLCW